MVRCDPNAFPAHALKKVPHAIDKMGDEAQIVTAVQLAFARHVAEVRSGLIRVKAVSSVPGKAVFAAVHSDDPDVNPVATCCKRPQIACIVSELGGRPLAVIQWADDPRKLIQNSLADAPHHLSGVKRSPLEVALDRAAHEATLSAGPVDAEYLSREGGLYLELASKLAGWPIKVKVVPDT